MKIDFADVLGLLFIALKLMGVISWSWWWVTFPIWFSGALALLSFGLVLSWGLAVRGFK